MKLELHWRILIGLVLGIVLGYIFSLNNLAGADNPQIGIIELNHITWMGEVFLRLLKMIVIPVIMLSLISGISHLPVKNLGKIGLTTLLIFKGQMLFAAFFGLFFVNILRPGDHIDLHKVLDNGDPAEDIHFITDSSLGITDLLLSMIPSNIFEALSNGTLIQIIIFSIIIAVALVQVKDGKKVLDMLQVVLDAILKVTHWIMELAPYGVFALITKTVAVGGISSIAEYS